MNEHLYHRHSILVETQELAARYPEMGISPDSLFILNDDMLYGTMRYLQRHHQQETADG